MIILPGPDIAGDILVTPVSVRRGCRSVSGVKVPILRRLQQSFAEIADPAAAPSYVLGSIYTGERVRQTRYRCVYTGSTFTVSQKNWATLIFTVTLSATKLRCGGKYYSYLIRKWFLVTMQKSIKIGQHLTKLQ